MREAVKTPPGSSEQHIVTKYRLSYLISTHDWNVTEFDRGGNANTLTSWPTEQIRLKPFQFLEQSIHALVELRCSLLEFTRLLSSGRL